MKCSLPKWCRQKLTVVLHEKISKVDKKYGIISKKKSKISMKLVRLEQWVSHSFFVPTFDTKVTEKLCSGWVFFLQTNFDFLTSHFWRNFLYHSKGIVVLSLNLRRYFTCDHFSCSYEGLKITILANLGQLTRDIIRAINA